MMPRDDVERLARSYGLVVLICLATLLFITPLLLRIFAGAPITPGPSSYTELRYAEAFQHGIVSTDTADGSRIVPQPYTAFLAGFRALGVPWLLPFMLIVSLIIGLISYLPALTDSKAIVVLTIAVFLISPSTSSLATEHAPALLFLCFFVYALLLRRRYPLLAGCLFVLAFITHLPLALLSCVVVACILLIHRARRDATIIMGAFVLATLWHMLWLGGRPAMTALVPLLDARIFFELGNLSGVSIFFVVLAVYGLLTQLKRNKDLAAWTVMLFVAMFFLPVISPFSMFAIALFAACGVHELMTTTWDLELLQQSLLILIMCISLFLAITTVRERVADDPTPGFAHAMVTLRNQYHAGSVLTAPRYAPLIVSFTGRNASLPADANNDEIRTAFSRMPEEVYPFLNHTKTSYVLVTQDMRRDLLPRDDDGLLFLLQNTERFVNIDKNNETSLWFFISG